MRTLTWKSKIISDFYKYKIDQLPLICQDPNAFEEKVVYAKSSNELQVLENELKIMIYVRENLQQWTQSMIHTTIEYCEADSTDSIDKILDTAYNLEDGEIINLMRKKISTLRVQYNISHNNV